MNLKYWIDKLKEDLMSLSTKKKQKFVPFITSEIMRKELKRYGFVSVDFINIKNEPRTEETHHVIVPKRQKPSAKEKKKTTWW